MNGYWVVDKLGDSWSTSTVIGPVTEITKVTQNNTGMYTKGSSQQTFVQMVILKTGVCIFVLHIGIHPWLAHLGAINAICITTNCFTICITTNHTSYIVVCHVLVFCIDIYLMFFDIRPCIKNMYTCDNIPPHDEL